MKVYLVEVGEYSDRRVVAIFDEEHKEEAERVVELICGDLDGPWKLNEFDMDEPPKGMRFFHLVMRRDGNVPSGWDFREESVLGGVYSGDEIGKRREEEYYLEDHERFPSMRKSYWRLHVELYAKDREHALKIANEIRVQILAGNKPKKGPIR